MVQPVQNIVGGADTTRQADPSLSLIIPAYNEAARIDATVREAVGWLNGQPFATELIVVDDGSDDATADLAERALSELGCGLVVRIAHGGKAGKHCLDCGVSANALPPWAVGFLCASFSALSASLWPVRDIRGWPW